MYDSAFYDAIRPGVQRSAGIVIPLVLQEVWPVRTVIDVGCGEGWWALGFAEYGCEVTGVDGAYVAEHSPLGEHFVPWDLAEGLPPLPPADLVVCLEVAEHLPKSRAASFIADLCSIAKTAVLFSAAIPHQGGAGHINCQWPSWWERLFAEHGFDLDGTLREQIWSQAEVEPWYRQNLMLATRGRAGQGNPVMDLVHPAIYEWAFEAATPAA